MTSDSRIQSALAHWAPRFVANGVALTDFEEVTASLVSWDEWCRAWSARAAVHEELGRVALARDKHLSAGEHLQRAGVYYHFGKFLFVHDIPQMRAAHAKAVECRLLALSHLDPPGERVEIPYEGKSLYGILRKPSSLGHFRKSAISIVVIKRVVPVIRDEEIVEAVVIVIADCDGGSPTGPH